MQQPDHPQVKYPRSLDCAVSLPRASLRPDDALCAVTDNVRESHDMHVKIVLLMRPGHSMRPHQCCGAPERLQSLAKADMANMGDTHRQH